mmetsp:Transcript_30410/g.43567  ORF Transcript_30410/g.43567 Transcript_30410/m.43567 type:complete len:440 (+) Transcript_30410:2-1321(+)
MKTLLTIGIVLISSGTVKSIAHKLVRNDSSRGRLHKHRVNDVYDSEINNYCNRPWPSLDIFVPVSFGYTGKYSWRNNEFDRFFLRSFMLFWPLAVSNTSLNILVDIESQQDPHFLALKKLVVTKVVPKVPGGAKFTFNHPSTYYRKGADRQQLLMFWGDNFTSSEYVGFADADTVFVTYIDREDLFEDGKPVVNARSGAHCCDVWALMPQGTFLATGLLEPMRCMSYFPVIIKTSHLKEIRDFISRQHHNRSFNDIFYENITAFSYYSQFNIMCTYLFHYHKEDYKWYVHTETPMWDGVNPAPLQGQDGNLSTLFTPSMYLPKPRVATHARYRGKNDPKIVKYTEVLNFLFQRGVCMSPPFPRTEKVCDETQQTVREGYFDEMHKFEYFDMTQIKYNNTPEMLQHEFLMRYERIKNCSHDWPKEEMKRIMIPINDMRED